MFHIDVRLTLAIVVPIPIVMSPPTKNKETQRLSFEAILEVLTSLKVPIEMYFDRRAPKGEGGQKKTKEVGDHGWWMDD